MINLVICMVANTYVRICTKDITHNKEFFNAVMVHSIGCGVFTTTLRRGTYHAASESNPVTDLDTLRDVCNYYSDTFTLCPYSQYYFSVACCQCIYTFKNTPIDASDLVFSC